MRPSQHKREEDVMSDTLVDIDNLVASESDVEQSEDKLDGHSNPQSALLRPKCLRQHLQWSKSRPSSPRSHSNAESKYQAKDFFSQIWARG